MTNPKQALTVRYIIDNYPDCPQRQMALGLFRDGRTEQAEAWLDALDEFIEKGRATFAEEQDHRSA